MKVTAQTIQLPRTTKIKVEKVKADGTIITFYTGSFIEHSDYSKAANRLGVDESVISSVVDGKLRKDEKPYEIHLVTQKSSKPKFRVRKETGSKSQAWLFDEFSDAINIAKPGSDTVIEWDNTEWVCNLDFDFDIYKPTPEQLIAFCETIKPAPNYYWLSRNGGLHLIYYSTDIYQSDELASVAAYHLFRRFPNGKVEFLKRTRNPAKEYFTRNPDTNIDIIRALLLEPTETDCNAWLEEHDFIVGQRYPHTRCPVAPSDRAKSNTPPVVIYEDHVYCYICKADNKCCGSRRAGFFPIPALAGGRVNTQIANAVNNFVHWSHAKHIMLGQIQNEEHARLLYSTLLKLKHGDDIRIPMVFKAAEPNGLIRYQGYWCDYSGKAVELEKGSSILRQLPHCHDLLPNGNTEINTATVEWLSKSIDQSTRGYYAVTPIRGIHFSQYQELPANKIYNILQSPKLSANDLNTIKRRPEYLPEKMRMDLSTAWGVLEKVFPGIDTKYIELLLIGRGCMEHRAGLPPMVFCTGHTGSGKTTHVQIAAAICGDEESTVHLKRERDRFLNGVLHAKNTGGFVLFDEYFKYAKQAGLDDVEAMEQLLSFTEDSLIYLIHVGSIPLGSLPFFIWCDNDVPHTVKAHEQIGRRVIYHKLVNTLNWEESVKRSEITHAKYIRSHGNTEMILACNTILSHVIEKHFTCPATDFIDTAKSLGFKLIRESSEVNEKHNLIRELFQLVCTAPDITDAVEKKRWSPPGFKTFKSNGMDKLYTALEICQTDDEKNTPNCKLLDATDLRFVLKTKVPCKVDIRKHGMVYAIRFASLDNSLVNDKLIAQ